MASSPSTSVSQCNIICLGVACEDIVAMVDEYPARDTKNVTTARHWFGGGNGANVAVGLARLLGSSSADTEEGERVDRPRVRLVTSLFGCSGGIKVAAELKREGVDLSLAETHDQGHTGSSYIVLDLATHSRTIFHTPQSHSRQILDAANTLQCLQKSTDVSVVFLDGRFPQAALEIAQVAAKKRVPVFMDLERVRGEHTVATLPYCTGVVCGGNFLRDLFASGKGGGSVTTVAAEGGEPPQEIASLDPESNVRTLPLDTALEGGVLENVNRLAQLLQNYPELNFAVSTAGARGSFCLMRDSDPRSSAQSSPSLPTTTQFEPPRQDSQSVIIRSIHDIEGKVLTSDIKAMLVHTSAWLPSEAKVVDTTGAGDSFSAGVVYGVAHGWSVPRCLQLGACVAGFGVSSLGSHPGLPIVDGALGDEGENPVNVMARLRRPPSCS